MNVRVVGPARDRFDDAGGAALNSLFAVDGRDAYDRMLELSRNPAVGESAHRLRELAYEMAERQSERPPWSAGEVRDFEIKATGPIRSAADLFDLVRSLVIDIAASFSIADMSPKSVVRTAEDESAVQDWLGSELNQRSGGRFHAHKEAQIVNHDRPDIIVASASSSDEVAIEVKHGNMNWSFADLSEALADQLATRYLGPDNRRHGLLVISNHRESRFWRDKARKRRIPFAELIEKLQKQARGTTENDTGPVTVDVRGIDAAAARSRKTEAPNAPPKKRNAASSSKR